MRVLVYGLNYSPELTGTGRYSGEMAEWLAARGHEVEAIVAPPYYPEWRISPNYSGRGFRCEVLHGVKVYRAPLYVPPPDKVSAKTRILMETSYGVSSLCYWLPRFVSPRKCDVVIAVCPPLQVGIVPWLFNQVRGVPWVFHIQDLQVDAAVRLGILKAGAFERFFYETERFLLRRAIRVSTITEAMRRRVVEKGVPEENTWLFPNWSDISFVRPLPRKNSFRQELGLGNDSVLVAYAGNMGEKQGLDLVLDAAERLRGRVEIRFAMIGAGAARPRLERIARERRLTNVSFHPVQPLERLPEMLAAADIHLVVQRREAADLVMPSKLTNILAAGRPSLATADAGTAIHDVLVKFNAGLVTPPGDVDAFVIALQRLVDNPTLRADMGRNARAYAERFLDKDAILSKFEESLIGLVTARNRA